MAKTPERKDWLIYKFRQDLRDLVTEEGQQHGRTAPKQLEMILAERYGVPMLTEEDKREAKEQVRGKKERPTVTRPRKGSRKDAAA